VTGPLIAAVAVVVTLVATPLVIVVAKRTGIVDRPGALKPQADPVPYLGGVAVFAGVVVGAAAGRPTVLIPLAGALALGVADDRLDLAPWIRLVGQVVIGIAVVVACPVHLPGVAAAAIIPVVAVVVINGVNLIDGLDMLAGGVAGVGAFGFAAVLHGAGRQLALALGAALVGFLVYNRPPARVYLGDGGSYLLGAGLTVLLAEAWGPGTPLPVGVAALVLVAIPVAEVAFAAIRRLRGRSSLMAGDRGHPYDRLVSRGWPRPAYIVTELVLAAAAVGAVHLDSTGWALTAAAFGAMVLFAGALATGALTPDQETTP
jgi:UDP-GlcNAc:undecaprenyl-phosphate GlcNAc-1-phosphate transferase